MRCAPALPVILAFSLAGIARAAPTEWTDADGQRFTGEPIEVFGSIALFRTDQPLVRRVPLLNLSDEDCRRFHQAMTGPPARATRWTEAQGLATRELPGAVRRLDYQYRKLVPADLGTIPEPQVLLILYGSHGDYSTWSMLNDLIPTHLRIQNVYPGVVATVFYGLWHSAEEHSRLAVETWAPWLTTELSRQKGMTVLSRLAPKNGPLMLALTRHGDVLLSARPENLAATRQFVDDLSDLLWAINPANNRAWAERAHYGQAVRPLEFAQTSTGPLLVGNPLKTDGLRQRGITRVEARLDVDAKGKVTSAVLLPGSAVPEKMAAPLADALRKNTVFLPAVDHGTAIASSYDYLLEVPPANPQAEADAAWLDGTIHGEVPLPNWKILKTIPVNQQEFAAIDHVESDGKVVMRSFEVSKARVSRASQLSAFNTDWFAEAGADSVQPEDGQTQVVDGLTLTWHAIESDNGYVDLQAGESPQREYCVGYAWTEIEVSADTSAWLGIGSDDGLKIWHNGKLVDDRWVRRSSRLDDDIVPLRLKQGKNHLLIKIQNALGAWSFVTRLRYRDR